MHDFNKPIFDKRHQSLRMDQINGVIKLHNEGIVKKQTSQILGMSRTTLKKYITQIEPAGGCEWFV